MKNNKFLSVSIYFVFIFLLLLNYTAAQDAKPDLIITQVTSKIFTPEHKYIPGEPVRGSGNRPYLEYTITIKNIGTGDLLIPFYIAWQNPPFDYNSDHYSRTMVVNRECNLIPVGGSMDFKTIGGNSTEYSNGVRFFIQTDGKRHDKTIFPKIEELNYDNNTFIY